MGSRLRASTKVNLIIVALLLAVLGGGAAGQAAVKRAETINTYRYEITVAGSGQVNTFAPYQPYGLMYMGAVSGTFSVKYQVAITVDSGAQTVAAHSLNTTDDPSPNPVTVPAGVPHSLSVNGTSSLSVTASCAGPPCMGPPTTCAYSSGDISPYYRTNDGRLYMSGIEQLDHASYASGALWFEQIMNGTNPTAPAPTPCTGGNDGHGGGRAVSPISPADIPGFTDGSPSWSTDNHAFSPIPLAELGEPLIQHSFSANGSCEIDLAAETACTAQVTVTMKLLPAPSDTLHVGHVDISESERIQRLIQQLQPQVGALTAAKATLEEQIATQTERASTMSTAVDTLNAQLPAITATFNQDSSFLSQLTAGESKLPDNVKKELAQEEQTATRLGELQDGLVGARDSGDATTAAHLQKQVASLQKLVDQLVAELHGKLSSLDPTLDKWLTQTRAHQFQLTTVQLQLSSAMFDREEAGDALKDLNARRTAADDELNTLVEKFLAVDFLPDQVTVTEPSGAVVFKADVSKRAQVDLQQIDHDLAAAKPADEELAKLRKSALKDFLDAEAVSSRALVNVSEVIWSVAQKKAAVDFIYNLYDVGKAASKGGLVGAVAETLKKVVEAVIKEGLDSGGGQLLTELRHPGIPWASSASNHYWVGDAKELSARFQTDAKLSNQYFGDQARKIALERLYKDSITGPGKDLLNKKIGTVILKWWKDVPFPVSEYGPAAQLTNVGQLKKEAQWVAKNYKVWLPIFTSHQAHIKDLAKGSKLLSASNLVKAGATKNVLKPVAGDLLASFFKDLSKNMWKGYYDVKEQQAWSAYFEKEAAAQALYLPWQQAGAVYDSLHEYVQALEADKADLLVGYDPSNGTKVLVDKKFKTGTKLKIALKLFRPSGGTNTIDFDIVLGGRSAVGTGKYTSSVATTDLTEGQSGLGLTITAR
jgi:hypothetical protein